METKRENVVDIMATLLAPPVQQETDAHDHDMPTAALADEFGGGAAAAAAAAAAEVWCCLMIYLYVIDIEE
jgi:hypothetical protein